MPATTQLQAQAPAADEYSTPLPQGATVGASDEYSTPIPQGASTGQPAQSQVPDSLHKTDTDNITQVPLNFAKGMNAIGAGVGQGVLSTLGGALHLADKVTGTDPAKDSWTRTIDQKADELRQQNSENPGLNAMGYGGETLMEFLGGEAALKALPASEFMARGAKIMKTIEGSERLTTALKVGAAALSGDAEQAAAFIKQYPKVARALLHAAEPALAGTVQGAQTYVRTGGDAGAAGEDALGAAATAGVLHGVTAGVGKLGGKLRKTAQTMEEMNNRAAAGPTAQGANDVLENTVNDVYRKETGTLNENLNDATSKLETFGAGAAPRTSITETAQQMVKDARKRLSQNYVNKAQELTERIGNEEETGEPRTIEYEGSPLHQAAQELTAEGQTSAGPLDEAINVSRPGSARTSALLDRMTNLDDGEEEPEDEGAGAILKEFLPKAEDAGEDEEDGEGGKEGPTGTRPLTLQNLLDYRHRFAERMRNLGYSDSGDRADRLIYQRLLQGVDDTIGRMADESGDPEARTTLDGMNSEYRQGIQPFNNPDVKAVLEGNLNDVVKRMTAGATSIDDINDLRKVIGKNNLQHLADESLRNTVKDSMDENGTLNYKKLFTKWGNMNGEVRQAMYGGTGKGIGKSLEIATRSSEALDQIGKTIKSFTEGGYEGLLKDPKKVDDLAKAIGPEGMRTLGQTMLEREIRNASLRPTSTGAFVPDRFNPEKVLDWWNTTFKEHPEVHDQFFAMDGKAKQQYQDLMQRLSSANSVRRLVKVGILPLTVAGAGTHGLLPALVTAMSGYGMAKATDLLDHVANHPATWRLLGGVAALGEKANAGGPVARTAKNATYNVMKSVNDSLSGSR